MIDQNTPIRYLATCTFCAAQLDTRDVRHYQRMVGWALNRNRGNSVTLGVRRARWACHECIGKLKNGIPVGQQSLFMVVDDDEQ